MAQITEIFDLVTSQIKITSIEIKSKSNHVSKSNILYTNQINTCDSITI